MSSSDIHLQTSPRKWLIVILALIPPVVLTVFIVKYRVEAPVADIWEIVPLIEKSYSGKLTIRDLWALHNEHRPIFSRTILVYLARLTHWTVLYELLASVLCALITFFSLLHLSKKVESKSGGSFIGLVAPISLIVFSLNQSEAWFGGYNLQIFMSIAAVTLGFIMLAVSSPNWMRTVFAATLGIVATFTFANGLLFWPLGIWILWKRRQNGSWKPIIFWILIAATVILFYFWGYQRPSHHPSPWSFFQQPLQAVNYIFAYLGAPLLAFCKKSGAVAEWLSLKGFSPPSFLIWIFENAASIVGAIGIGVFFYAFRHVRNLKQNGILILLLALSGYVVLSAVVSSFGRSAMGIQSALSLRYVPISSLFWISLLVFLKIASNTSVKSRFVNFSVATVVFFVIVNSIYGGLYAIKRHGYLMPARNELYRMQNEELLKRLHPDTDYIRHSLPILKKHRLSVFKGQEK